MAKFAVDVEMRIYQTIVVEAADDEEAYNTVYAEMKEGNIEFNSAFDVNEWEILEVWEK